MAKPETFTAATFNIQHGTPDGIYNHSGDPELVAKAITELDCDLIGLQEVDAGLRRSKFVNLAEYAAAAAGMRCIFGPAGTFRGRGKVGNAWLVRGEIVDEAVVDLPGDRHTTKILGHSVNLVRMPRNVHVARFALEAGELTAGNLHISGNHPAMLQYAAHVVTLRAGPHLLLGDFNMRWQKVQECVTPSGLRVFPAAGVNSDHIAVKGLDVIGVEKYRLNNDVSDHDPVRGEFAFSASPGQSA